MSARELAVVVVAADFAAAVAVAATVTFTLLLYSYQSEFFTLTAIKHIILRIGSSS